MRTFAAIAVVIAVGAAIWHFLLAGQVAMYLYPVKYSAEVERYSDEFGLPSGLVYAVIRTESSFRPDAVSGAGAKGLMQLTDDTNVWVAALLGEPVGDSIFEPEQNIRRGCCLLAYLYRTFGGWNETLAAYNAGIGRVRGWLESPEYSSDGATLDSIPIKETREYIVRVLGSEKKYREIYGIH